MTSMWKVLAAAIALVALTSQALAGSSCARPDESLALRTAAIQQKLMVAALYCQDVGRYNRFVISYQKELQDSDAAMMAYFRRAGAGDADYHAYKTRLANAFSLAGLHEMKTFCEAARAVYDTALEGRPQPLAVLISALPDARVSGQNDCPDVREARDTTGSGASGGAPIAAAGMGGSGFVHP